MHKGRKDAFMISLVVFSVTALAALCLCVLGLVDVFLTLANFTLTERMYYDKITINSC